MNYYQTLQKIKDTAYLQPNIHSVVRKFEDLNREDAKYTAIIIQDITHQRGLDYMKYTFYLGEADRENAKKSNRDFNYSNGINDLNNIVNSLLKDENIADVEFTNIICLEQKFLGECTVVYGTLTVTVPINDCFNFYTDKGDFNDDYNDDYNNEK